MSLCTNLDLSILTYIQEFFRTNFLTFFFEEITDLGNGGWFWLVLGLGLMAKKKTRLPGFLVLAAVAASGAVNNLVLKTLVDRARPFLADPGIHNLVNAAGSSFPSGHTGSSFAAAGILWQTMPRLYGCLAMVLATLIGLSRIYLGVHYPSDVLAGMLTGLLLAKLICKIYQTHACKVPLLEKNN